MKRPIPLFTVLTSAIAVLVVFAAIMSTKYIAHAKILEVLSANPPETIYRASRNGKLVAIPRLSQCVDDTISEQKFSLDGSSLKAITGHEDARLINGDWLLEKRPMWVTTTYFEAIEEYVDSIGEKQVARIKPPSLNGPAISYQHTRLDLPAKYSDQPLGGVEIIIANGRVNVRVPELLKARTPEFALTCEILSSVAVRALNSSQWATE
ncbi:hypothetical protein LMG667_19760 [Xanthomonas euvesicatoria]|uniref:hypothetical protein n=1 Tax=Xanthomonas euvesicatoria TaxID=456327 RepID=UPI00080E57D0|nr:hypothetical protein [Xanthomonas euvesicatoria]OCG82133.1 hypothetical protein LMG667_19760 [Xanthomonas euvesicatoria]